MEIDAVVEVSVFLYADTDFFCFDCWFISKINIVDILVEGKKIGRFPLRLFIFGCLIAFGGQKLMNLWMIFLGDFKLKEVDD